MIPGSATNALSANSPNNCDRAFNLFFYPLPSPTAFPSPPLVLPDVVVGTVGHPNKDSVKTPYAIPTAVNMDALIIPCSLKWPLSLSPSVPVSLSRNLVVDPLI